MMALPPALFSRQCVKTSLLMEGLIYQFINTPMPPEVAKWGNCFSEDADVVLSGIVAPGLYLLPALLDWIYQSSSPYNLSEHSGHKLWLNSASECNLRYSSS